MPSLYHFKSDQFKENFVLGGGGQHMVAGHLCQYLKGWQLDGIRFLYKHFEKGEACILNDESGLGKVVTVSVFLEAILRRDITKKCLIIVRDDEYIEGWRFHLSMLTQLSVKVIERTSDINLETVFLIKWSTLKNIGQITKTTFDYVVIDNRGEMLTNKFCTGILLRYFENKTSIIISSVDLTANIKLLHILLRLCGLLDKQYADLKTFEEKFQLPALKDGVCSKIDLEDYFLKREKVINFCREFRLRRYRHQFDEQFPLVSSSEFQRHIERWRNDKNSQDSGSVKLLSSSSEKDIEELFQAYFQVKHEQETMNNLDCEVQQITEHILDDANTEISDEVVVMSPLIFVSESESDSEQLPLTEMPNEPLDEIKEEECNVEETEDKEKACTTKHRRKSNAPIKRLTRSMDELRGKNLRSRSVCSDESVSQTGLKKHKTERATEKKVNKNRNEEDEVLPKRVKSKNQVPIREKDHTDKKEIRSTHAKDQNEKSNKKQLIETEKTIKVGNKRKPQTVDEKLQETNEASITTRTRLVADTKSFADERKSAKREKFLRGKLNEKEHTANHRKIQNKPNKDQSEANKSAEVVEKVNRCATTNAAKESRPEEKAKSDKGSKKDEAPRSATPNKGHKHEERMTTNDSSIKTVATKPAATKNISRNDDASAKSKKEDLLTEDSNKIAKKKNSTKSPRTGKATQLDMVLKEAQKFLKNDGNRSRRRTKSELEKSPRKCHASEQLKFKDQNVSKPKFATSPRKPLQIIVASRKTLPTKQEKHGNPKRSKSLTEYAPLGVHSRSTRGMERYTRSTATQNKYMKVSVAQVGVNKTSLTKRRSRSVAPKEMPPAPLKSTTPPAPAPAPVPQESPAVLESMQLGQALTPTNGLSELLAPSLKNADYNFPLMLDKDIPESECVITSQSNNKPEVIILTGSSTNDNEMEPPKSTITRRKTTLKPPMVTIPRTHYTKAQSPDLFSTCSDLSLPCSQQLHSKSNFEGFKIFGSEVRQPTKVRSCLDILDRIDNWSGTAAAARKTSSAQEQLSTLSQQNHDDDTMFEITSNGTFGNMIRVNSNGEMSPVRNRNQQTGSHPRNRITNYLINSNQYAASASPCPSSEDTTDALQKTPKRRKSLSGSAKRSPRGISGGKSQSTKLTQWLVKNSSVATKRRRLDLQFPSE